jgi:hypothetical protein
MRADTNQYVASHGKQPRGYGKWAFEVGRETYFFDGFYSEAKKAAFEVARDRHEHVVVVCP